MKLIISVILASMLSENPTKIAHRVAGQFVKKHNNFETSADVWGNYTLDLTLESMLLFDFYTGTNKFTPVVKHVMKLRDVGPDDTISYRSQPFCSINHTIYQVTKNKDYVAPYIYETNKMMAEIGRTMEGAICLTTKSDTNMLIDYLQEYAGRVAKTGKLTGQEKYFDEAVNQFLLYEKILRNPYNGLWSQGRGWLNNNVELSPGAWSRGHGWLLRGLVTTMMQLPENSHWQEKLQPVLERLSVALLNVQDSIGMWHQLLDYPFEISAPETSGTGMIAYYMTQAINHGYLDRDLFQAPVLKSINAMKKYVLKDGTITYTCKGPGPLYSVEGYINYIPEPNDEHGAQAFIYAMLAEILIEQ